MRSYLVYVCPSHETMKHHYIYYSYEEFGRGYIGSRSCDCAPEGDSGYFGSYRDKSFKPTNKVILATYSTREEALSEEIILHKAYDVGRNPQFANRAKATSTGFCVEGLTHSEGTKQKIREANLGKNHTEGTRQRLSEINSGSNHPRFGKTNSDEHKQKIRESNTGKKHSEEHKQKIGEANTNPTEETRQKIREARIGTRRWVNSHGETRQQPESPGPEWQRGTKWRGASK